MAGFDGLWRLGRKVNRLVLSWNFIQHLMEEGLALREIECQAWQRVVNREDKKGKKVKGLEKGVY